MTTQKARLARGLALISQGFAELSAAVTEEAVAVAPGAGAAPAPPEPSPFLDEVAPLQRTPTDGLGRCPVHGTAWTIRPGGVSKAGKPYHAFHKCDGKNDDGTYCQQKPIKAWADAHPIAG